MATTSSSRSCQAHLERLLRQKPSRATSRPARRVDASDAQPPWPSCDVWTGRVGTRMSRTASRFLQFVCSAAPRVRVSTRGWATRARRRRSARWVECREAARGCRARALQSLGRGPPDLAPSLRGWSVYRHPGGLSFSHCSFAFGAFVRSTTAVSGGGARQASYRRRPRERETSQVGPGSSNLGSLTLRAELNVEGDPGQLS